MTRALTDDERELRDRRRANFNGFFEERVPVLAEFLGLLQLPEPRAVMSDAWRFLPAVDQWVAVQVIAPENRIWLMTRLAYLLGELLCQRYGGSWFLNEVVDSRFFLRYVVGRFSSVPNPLAMVDPFEPINELLAGPPGRSLSRLVSEIQGELENA
jgi:hypothetical protein